MGAGSGVALKFVQWSIRGIQFCCAGLILGVYSYFLAALRNHDLPIATYIRAVEGIAGAAALYTAIGLLLLCCLAGHPVTSFIAMALDVAFAGAFVYVAIANRGGAGSCSGRVDTPFGSGDAMANVADDGSGGFTNLPRFYTACKLETACFAVAIVAVIFFLLSILVELALARHRQRSKRFGPGPANGYTEGYGKRGRGGFFSRFGRGRRNRHSAVSNPNALPAHSHPNDVRSSYTTDATAVNPDGLPAHGGKHGTLEKPSHHGILGHHGATAEPAAAHYPTGNYQYEDGVYHPRAS